MSVMRFIEHNASDMFLNYLCCNLHVNFNCQHDLMADDPVVLKIKQITVIRRVWRASFWSKFLWGYTRGSQLHSSLPWTGLSVEEGSRCVLAHLNLISTRTLLWGKNIAVVYFAYCLFSLIFIFWFWHILE